MYIIKRSYINIPYLFISDIIYTNSENSNQEENSNI